MEFLIILVIVNIGKEKMVHCKMLQFRIAEIQCPAIARHYDIIDRQDNVIIKTVRFDRDSLKIVTDFYFLTKICFLCALLTTQTYLLNKCFEHLLG